MLDDSLKSMPLKIDDLQSGNDVILTDGKLPTFKDRLKQSGFEVLRPLKPEIFQVNVGYMCNQTCKHCHVDAGPHRKEKMSVEVMKLCLEKIEEFSTDIVDITGGAPEMNENFRWFVGELRKTKVREIIVRSNLTIIVSNPKYLELPEFFAENNLRVVSSLPYYQASKTDRQRGNGVFDRSIKALKLLNEVGYGKDFMLDLVYNPSGAFLPGNQSELERDFKNVLLNEHRVVFNNLLALTNLPINRFLEYLMESGNYDDYMEKLISSFNPAAVDGLMCKNTLSVDYLGNVYDCDFNQMLNMPVKLDGRKHLSELTLDDLMEREIKVAEHCFGCTAGAGSGCQGTLVS